MSTYIETSRMIEGRATSLRGSEKPTPSKEKWLHEYLGTDMELKTARSNTTVGGGYSIKWRLAFT